MRALGWLTAGCLSGAMCVIALAEARSEGATPAPRPRPPIELRPRRAPSTRAPAAARSIELDSPPAPVAPRADPPVAEIAKPQPVAKTVAPAHVAPRASEAPPAELFANTYYDFPVDDGGAEDAAIYDLRCQRIAAVSRRFHDRVCVQGSGRLVSGATVSFAGRDCPCADACPRTGQRICFEALDPGHFPNGRGAAGRPITPLRTVAVDPSVVPLGTTLFIPDFVGLPRPDGTPHDGCFVAEDRGLRVKGPRIDVFAGDERTRLAWEALVPSNHGVRVLAGGARCGGAR